MLLQMEVRNSAFSTLKTIAGISNRYTVIMHNCNSDYCGYAGLSYITDSYRWEFSST